jgi:hypothetical protein
MREDEREGKEVEREEIKAIAVSRRKLLDQILK